MTKGREITPPPGFLAVPTTTTMFAATTPENTPLANRTSTSTNPNPVITPTFVEANYETLKSLLKDRRRKMRNNDLRTKLEYISEDYDKEREMKPRPRPARAITPPLRAASPRVRRRKERVVGFEETQNRGESRVKRKNKGGRPSEEAPRGNGSQNVNLPPLLAAYIWRSENGHPLQSSLTSVYGGQALSNNVGGNLPPNDTFLSHNAQPFIPANLNILGLHEDQRIFGFIHGLRTKSLVEHLSMNLPLTYKGLMEKTYTWVEAREVPTNGVSSDRRDSFERPNKSSWDNNRGQKNKDRKNSHVENRDRGLNNSRGHKVSHQKGVKTVLSAGEAGEETKKARRTLTISKERIPSCDDTREKIVVNDKRNLEAYVDDMVIKRTSEEGMLSNIQETFERFRSINMKLNPKKCSFGVEEGPFLGCRITKQGIKANPLNIKAVTELEQPRALKDIQSLNGKLAALSRFLSNGAERSLPFFKAIELGKHDIVFLKRYEREMPADFLPEIPFDDNEKRVKEKEVSDPSKEWKLYTNGAFSLDGAGAGLMLIDPVGKEYTYALRFMFETTYNKVEYDALLAGLHIAQEMEITKVAIYLDLQLVVNQIKGTYAVKQLSIKSYLQKVKTALTGFEGYTVEHVQRNQNKKADALSKLASMTYEHLIKEVLVEVLAKRSIEEKEVLKV
uniref:Reverse transcriptase domain-containing protein n=1 Tax=Tanacetum cinerariifolium TaxID=118510 RepID=A0A6L2J572_TANCI|nr:reverse transcriptase domain-containing protein [Tanacetum cinerariifolium]